MITITSACTHLWAEYYGPRWLIYVAKPTTTSAILLLAWFGEGLFPFYHYAIVAGLLLSLAGDIWLMLPSDHFMAGLLSFFVAHCCYSAAFGSRLTELPSLFGLLPMLLYTALIYHWLAPYLDPMRLPVILYMSMITLMAWLAIAFYLQAGTWQSFFACSGAILFVLSDSALALNRFRGSFGSAQALVLSTYYGAQWFIARSI
ncbi:MAG: lysoplasmalogenase [Caldilineaceae bacterium]